VVDDERDGVVTLTDLLRSGGDGVAWSLPAHASHDLNVNLVQLGPHASVDAHRNDEVDVLVIVRAGAGEIVVDGRVTPIVADQLMLVPRNSTRAIRAGADGLVYLTVHRARGAMTVRRNA
jgi:quercetin dioxygenase-like cupin family protein